MEALRAVSPEFDSHNTTTGADGLTVYNLTLGDTPAGLPWKHSPTTDSQDA